MPVRWEMIEPLLMQVTKPARYVGGEFNQVVKPEAAVRCCLAFPDLYEIGMSYHGFRILYERINAREGWAAERAYAPWPDFEALMRLNQVPLYSLETRRTLGEFDWIGFTLQHEVNFTNVLNMIDLAGLPLESKDRPEGAPILIGGGEGAYSPEPLAPFLDAFVLGDGEDSALELMALFQQVKTEAWDRARILLELDRLPGVYVPAFYEVDYQPDGRIAALRKTRGQITPDAPNVHKRYHNVATDLGTTHPVVPLLRTVHDRLVIEIRRGCVNGCRFCQAGMLNRPVHERPMEQIIDIARAGIRATGYDTISLLSLSSGDYTLIAPLMRRLTDEFTDQGIQVTLPSLRINGFDISLMDELGKVRQSGFTFAPEAGTERLRKVINKPVDQDYFFKLIEDVFQRGWQTVKFYFMIGLPTETDADLDGIVDTCVAAAELGWRHHRKRAMVNVTLSPFVPKGHTPFQWEAQVPREEMERRFRYVRQAVYERAGRSVDIRTADTKASFFEAVLARGDRRMAAAIRRAWELGARFDGWDEHFNLDRWLQAFADVGLDPTFYANRERGEDEILPFDHLNADLGRRFLWADRHRAGSGVASGKCDTGPCAGCDVCDDAAGIGHTLAKDMAENTQEKTNGSQEHATSEELPTLPSPTEREQAPLRVRGAAAHASPLPVQRIRLTFTRLEGLRYLSHLDFAKVMGMILRRAEIPLAYTQGFNPLPRVQYAPPLSLGMGGTHEFVDLMLISPMSPRVVLERLTAIPLQGLNYLGAEEVALKADSLEVQIEASVYHIEFVNAELDVTAERLTECLQRLADAPAWPVEVEKKNGRRKVDLKESLRLIEPDHAGAGNEQETGRPGLRLAIHHKPGLFVKPHEIAGFLLGTGRALELGRDVRINRIGYCLKD